MKATKNNMSFIKGYISNFKKKTDLPEVIKRDKWPPPPIIKSAEIILGEKCNLSCMFCCVHKSIGKWQPFNKVKEDIYRAKEEKKDMLIFSGGEPTLYPHILEAINEAKKLKFPIIEILTNGVRCADFNFSKELADAGLTLAKVAIHSPYEKIHNKLTGKQDSFKNALLGIKNLDSVGIYTSTNFAINKLNYKHLYEYAQIFIGLLNLTGFCFFFEFYSGKILSSNKLRVKYSDVLPYINKLLEFIKTKKVRIDWPFLGNFVPCLLPHYVNVMIDWGTTDKNINDSISLNSNYETLKELHNKRKIKIKQCKECIYYDKCNGIDKSYIAEYGSSEFIPVKKEKEQFLSPLYM